MTPEEMFQRLMNPDIPRFLGDAGPRVKAHAEGNWPSSEHPENIWTTDRSVRRFTLAPEGDRTTLTNEADYSGYTDDGFTFRGKATADPWSQRGGTPYLEQTADAVVEGEAQALLDHILDEARNG